MATEKALLKAFPAVGNTPLETINDIKFTHRELDILACILSGRAVKMIASLLSISPKTVEAHTRNIMLKLGCNSRENIIDFIEKAGCFLELRKRYQSLVTRGHFEQYLRRLSSFTSQKDCTCLIIDKREYTDDTSIQQLTCHLELLGIKVLSTEGPCDYVLYIGTHLSVNPTNGFLF